MTHIQDLDGETVGHTGSGLTDEQATLSIGIEPIKMSHLKTVRSLIDGVIAQQEKLQAMQDLIERGGIETGRTQKPARSNFSSNARNALGLGSAVELSPQELLAVLEIRIKAVAYSLNKQIENLHRYNVRIERDGTIALGTVQSMHTTDPDHSFGSADLDDDEAA